MSVWAVVLAATPLALEVVWGVVFLPRAWRCCHRPGGWWGTEFEVPPTLEADLAWRELFVLYHLPGVALVDTVWTVLRLRHSMLSAAAVMIVTGGLYASGVWFVFRAL